MQFIIPISGKDSLATAIVQREREPDRPYTYFFNAVGSETPDVDQWLDRVETTLAIQIVRVGESLIDIIELQGILPSIHARYCTRKAKIEPMEHFIGDDYAIVYYGIRADEQRAGYNNSTSPNITPIYPLRDLGLGINDVYKLLQDRQLLPPSYHWPLLEQLTQYELSKSIAAYDLPLWLRTHLFSWRSRMNCYHCFFQRPYEWIGLYYHYPDLFWRAVAMEETIGGNGFTWNTDRRSLRSFIEDQDAILTRRARKIAKIIENREHDETDLLNVVSCGLLCGK